MRTQNYACKTTLVANTVKTTGGDSSADLNKAQVGGHNQEGISIAFPGGTGDPSVTGSIIEDVTINMGSLFGEDTVGRLPGISGYKLSRRSTDIVPSKIEKLYKVPFRKRIKSWASLTLNSDAVKVGEANEIILKVTGTDARSLVNRDLIISGIGTKIDNPAGGTQTHADPTYTLSEGVNRLLKHPETKGFFKLGGLNGADTTRGTGAEANNSDPASITVTTGGTSYAIGNDFGTTGKTATVTGVGMVVNVNTVSGGAVTKISIANPGRGYKANDIVYINKTDGGTTNRAELTIKKVTEGEIVVFSTNSGKTVATAYTRAQIGSTAAGGYTLSTDPTGTTKIKATLNIVEDYDQQKFSTTSFRRTDYYSITPTKLDLQYDTLEINLFSSSKEVGVRERIQGKTVLKGLADAEAWSHNYIYTSEKINEVLQSSNDYITPSDLYNSYYIHYKKKESVDNRYLVVVYVKEGNTSANAGMKKIMEGLSKLSNIPYDTSRT